MSRKGKCLHDLLRFNKKQYTSKSPQITYQDPKLGGTAQDQDEVADGPCRPLQGCLPVGEDQRDCEMQGLGTLQQYLPFVLALMCFFFHGWKTSLV